MAGTGQSGGNTATLNLILGIFLKLLGFFVVLYSYTEVNPIKAQQAEQSLKQRFNISVSLMPEVSGESEMEDSPMVQSRGNAYRAIEEELKGQLDLLSSRYIASSNTLVLRVPAKLVLPLNGQEPGTKDFAGTLTKVLETQHDTDHVYNAELIISGANSGDMTRIISNFVQQMIANGYDPDLLTIGYQDSDSEPMLEIRVTQVKAS